MEASSEWQWSNYARTGTRPGQGRDSVVCSHAVCCTATPAPHASLSDTFFLLKLVRPRHLGQLLVVPQVCGEVVLPTRGSR